MGGYGDSQLRFRTLEDDFLDGERIIKKARLYGFGIVDKPAYPQSVAAMRSWEEYRSAYGLEVRQQKAAERSVIISGPAGAGKTERARELIVDLQAQGLKPVAADFQKPLCCLASDFAGRGRSVPRTGRRCRVHS